jgi:hypothetical protein
MDGQIVVASAPYRNLSFLTGAGSVYATADDLVRFVDSIRTGLFGESVRDRLLNQDPSVWQGLYGRTNGYEASAELLLDEDLILVFLTNLQSASTWQLRDQVKNALTGAPVDPVPMPPVVSEYAEDPKSLVGHYGPAEITLIDGHLFRGDNEFYPVEDGDYYIPGSGTRMRFRRDSSGAVDALISMGAGRERTLPKNH